MHMVYWLHSLHMPDKTILHFLQPFCLWLLLVRVSAPNIVKYTHCLWWVWCPVLLLCHLTALPLRNPQEQELQSSWFPSVSIDLPSSSIRNDKVSSPNTLELSIVMDIVNCNGEWCSAGHTSETSSLCLACNCPCYESHMWQCSILLPYEHMMPEGVTGRRSSLMPEFEQFIHSCKVILSTQRANWNATNFMISTTNF